MDGQSQNACCQRAIDDHDVFRDIAACRPGLLRRALGLVGPAHAEDLAQDAVERALRRLDQFRPGTNLEAWIWRIMANLAADMFRQRRVRAGASVEAETLAAPAPEDTADWERLTPEQVRAAVRQLSPKLRGVFELHHDWKLQYEEIARELRIPVGTVSTRLRRARLRLRRMLTVVLDGPPPPAETARGEAAPVGDLEARRRRGAGEVVVRRAPVAQRLCG
jgi:RNA polymerase sigma-70 factor, ECF subfamily